MGEDSFEITSPMDTSNFLVQLLDHLFPTSDPMTTSFFKLEVYEILSLPEVALIYVFHHN